MRMDPTTRPDRGRRRSTPTRPRELARVLRDYGEERFAAGSPRRSCASGRQRRSRPARDSSTCSATAIPAATRRTGGHPAKRTFQALRIEVNGELSALGGALPAAVDALAMGGRIVVLSYHSLEDRLVKRTLGDLSRPDVPRGVPQVPPGHEALLRLVTRGAEKPTPEEVEQNPRATSARLRAAERIHPGRRPGSGNKGERHERAKRVHDKQWCHARDGGEVGSDMSILESLARPRREPEPERRLQVVPQVEVSRSRSPFVLLVVVVLGAGLVGLLLLNTTLQQGAFAIHDLKVANSQLEERQGSLEHRVARLKAPENLAGRAQAIGMVPNTNPVFLRLSDAAILGTAVPARARPTPKPAPKTTPQVTPKPTAPAPPPAAGHQAPNQQAPNQQDVPTQDPADPAPVALRGADG